MEFKNHCVRKLEEDYVKKVYDNIAHDFSGTRHNKWPKIHRFLLDSIADGSLILDVGCGNGKYLDSCDSGKIFSIGCDASVSLLDICRRRGYHVVACDMLFPPFRKKLFDCIVCIAALHHLASHDRRMECLRKLIELLRVNGQFLVYVWAFEQDRKGHPNVYLRSDLSEIQKSSLLNMQKEVMIVQDYEKSEITKLPVHKNRTKFVQQDILVPFRIKEKSTPRRENTTTHDGTPKDKYNLTLKSNIDKNANGLAQEHNDETKYKNLKLDQIEETKRKLTINKEFLRFYHVFREGELDGMIRQFPSMSIIDSYYDQGNWCVLARRVE